MFSLIKKLHQYFSLDDKEDLAKELNQQLDKLEDEDNTSIKYQPKSQELIKEDFSDKKCFRKTGIITSLESNHGVIDKTLLFDTTIAKTFHDLKIGFRVEYLAYIIPDSEYVKIIKIERILNDFWDLQEENNINDEVSILKEANPEYFNTHQRSILGVIIHRNQNFVIVDTDYQKIDVELDNVCLEFVPQVGDRVYLNCNVQTDLSFVDSTGEILETTSIHPARSKNIESFISEVNDFWGVINNEYHFTFDVLKSGYMPNENDKVCADVIESDRGKYIWRCTKIYPLETAINIKPQIKPKLNDSIPNKYGITATDFLKFKLTKLGDFDEKEMIVVNGSDRVQKVRKSVFYIKKSESQMELLNPKMNESFLINPGESKTFRFRVKAKFYGHSKERFAVLFDCGVQIAREIEIEVGENVDDQIKNNETSMQYRRNGFYAEQIWSKKYNLIPGVNNLNKPRFIANRIGMYDVPERLHRIVLTSENRSEMIETLESIYPCLTDDLTYENYCYRSQILLHLEEITYFLNIRNYDCERAHFQRQDEFLALEIEHLAEKRPSLVIGDSVRATNPFAENADNRCYEGVINKVLHNRILLKFNPGFHTKYNGEDYRIEFFFSRFTFRKKHYAIKKVHHHLGQEFLFPQKIMLGEKPQLDVGLNDNLNLVIQNSLEEIKWFNPDLNAVQKNAIKNILRGEASSMPYVIFGPPGTGKTMALIETILQLVTLLPSSRLLVATPSNSAADLIATRLINCEVLKPGDFVRLVSHNIIEKEMIPDHLKPYCATADIAREGTSKDGMIITDSGLKLKCQAKHLGRHRVTIGTCISLGTLLQMGFPNDHFSHVLIDEAGQCLESESMVAITQVDWKNGQIILAGDPMQLGPIVLNMYAVEKGLETSFLVRILQRFPYLKDNERFAENNGYDPRLVTKLIYNYRSIPSILKVCNDLFYDSELKPVIEESESSTEIQLLRKLNDILPPSETRSPNHGLYFVGIRGINRQDSDSPSWYNAAEAKSIFLFLIKLYKKQINSGDIGIITPYQKQVRAIRNVLLEAGLVLPKIGSVEEFQGQERGIILISTVRSTKSLIQLDLRHSLGFVESKKRMNVAISRAKSLLVIFGNPHLLTLDSSWNKLIKYCVSNDAYMGCDLPPHIC